MLDPVKGLAIQLMCDSGSAYDKGNGLDQRLVDIFTKDLENPLDSPISKFARAKNFAETFMVDYAEKFYKNALGSVVRTLAVPVGVELAKQVVSGKNPLEEPQLNQTINVGAEALGANKNSLGVSALKKVVFETARSMNKLYEPPKQEDNAMSTEPVMKAEIDAFAADIDDLTKFILNNATLIRDPSPLSHVALPNLHKAFIFHLHVRYGNDKEWSQIIKDPNYLKSIVSNEALMIHEGFTDNDTVR